jgi:DNA primase
MCLDGDDAGVHATLSIGDALLNEGIEVKVVLLPNPDDPDSYILNNGKDKFIGLVENALNFSDFKMMKLRENVNFNSDEEKANYINEVLKETVKIDDPIRVEVILKRLAKEFDISYNTLEMQFLGYKKNETKKEVIIPKKVNSTRKSKYMKAVEQILYFMLNSDTVISQVEKEHLILPSEESRVLCSEIIYYYKNYGSINVADFYTYVQDKELVCNFLNEILASDYNSEVTKEELFEYFNVVKEYAKKQEIKRLTNLMKKEVDPIEQAKISEKIRKLRIGE